MNVRDYMTVSEVAAALGAPARTIAYRLKRGLMRGERVTSRLWLVPRDEVERWQGRGKLPPGRKPRGGTEATTDPPPVQDPSQS